MNTEEQTILEEQTLLEEQNLLGEEQDLLEKNVKIFNDGFDDFNNLKYEKKKSSCSIFKYLICSSLFLISIAGIGYGIKQYFFTKPLSDEPVNAAICAIAKEENLYVREWVEYNKNLNISRIILYDNNEVDGEKFEDVIGDYIDEGFVEIVDRRGVVANATQSNQEAAYNDCYNKNYKKYDWIFFIDVDEFLAIERKYKNINQFLNDFDNDEFDGVKMQWRVYGDNEHLYYEDKPVIERFLSKSNMHHVPHVKSVVKCKERDYVMTFYAHGPLNKEAVMVNLFKKKIGINDKPTKNFPVYLNHFYTKSTEEFINRKFNKTDVHYGAGNYISQLESVKKLYYEYNKVTDEKEKMFNALKNKK